MYLCYIDESGVSGISDDTNHFVLAGLAIPIDQWAIYERRIVKIKTKYGLEDSEIHTGWLMRRYFEQEGIEGFKEMDRSLRRAAMNRVRRTRLSELRSAGNLKKRSKVEKNYRKTWDYIHLTYDERYRLVKDIAVSVSHWKDARLFAECIDKNYWDPILARNNSIDTQAFEQLVSRFEKFLQITERDGKDKLKNYGLLIHDNNETVAKKHTELMKGFYKSGTLWTDIDHIIETPLFVDSQLTSMVQIADMCSYAIRRYLEKGEEELFNLIFTRADRRYRTVVGVRHFTDSTCGCKICKAHNRTDNKK